MTLRVIKSTGFIFGILVAFLATTIHSRAQDSTSKDGAELTADQIAAELIGYMRGRAAEEKFKNYPSNLVSKLKSASAAEPNNDKYHYAIYFCELIKGDRKEALREIEAAYTHSRKDPQYLMPYVATLKVNWEPIKARDLMASFSKAHGKPVELELQVAVLNVTIQEYAAALPVIQKFLRYREGAVPLEESTGLLQQGICELYLGEPEKAMASFKKAIAIYPKNEWAKAEYSLAMIKSGNPKGALELLENEFQGHARGDFLYIKAVALEAVGRSSDAKLVYAEALTAGEEDLKIKDDNGKNHFYLSQICTKLGMEEKAKFYKSNATVLHFTFEPPFSTNAVNDPAIQK